MVEFGSTGQSKSVLMDCEIAAHNGIETVFPEWKVRSCYFHFTKNLIDYVKNNGLFDATNCVDFSTWINELLG